MKACSTALVKSFLLGKQTRIEMSYVSKVNQKVSPQKKQILIDTGFLAFWFIQNGFHSNSFNEWSLWHRFIQLADCRSGVKIRFSVDICTLKGDHWNRWDRQCPKSSNRTNCRPKICSHQTAESPLSNDPKLLNRTQPVLPLIVVRPLSLNGFLLTTWTFKAYFYFHFLFECPLNVDVPCFLVDSLAFH